jgi:hypothetical protein
MKAQRWKQLDIVGGALSIGCAIHCAVAPVLVAVMPVLADESVEAWLGSSLLVMASVAVLGGTFLHRSTKALFPLALGIAVFVGRRWLGAEGSPAELALVFVASGLFVTAHVLNYRACRGCCRAC